MIWFTGNYTNSSPNFVLDLPFGVAWDELQDTDRDIVEQSASDDLSGILLVLKKILSRGYPCHLSEYLKSSLSVDENAQKEFLQGKVVQFVTDQLPQWRNRIKGDDETGYNPAHRFFHEILPQALGDDSYLVNLILPEADLNSILGYTDSRFTHQSVDFYFPQVKLVIEIDGSSHQQPQQKYLDGKRDEALNQKGILVVRIPTARIQNGGIESDLNRIRKRILEEYADAIQPYRRFRENVFQHSRDLLTTGIYRLQMVLLELLLREKLRWGIEQEIVVLDRDCLGDFANHAKEDLNIWFRHLYRLKKKENPPPLQWTILTIRDEHEFSKYPNSLQIDFSILKRYTDEREDHPQRIYVRTDYIDSANYYRLESRPPIDYSITDDDKETLDFFLQNLFGNKTFRDGQFPIVMNALNLQDTLGLLPTGSGKSLCYQLSSTLQPCMSFVVVPIVSLMRDQVDNLNAVGIGRVGYINSDQTGEEKEQMIKRMSQGEFHLVFATPERFQITEFRKRLSDLRAKNHIAYAVIDEVHCLSEWGHDFRTSYLNLGRTIRGLSPMDEGRHQIRFLGLTATASVNVLKDIRAELGTENREIPAENVKTVLDYSRKELEFSVIKFSNQNQRMKYLQEQLSKIGNQEISKETLPKSVLVFTPNVDGEKGCYKVCNDLKKTSGFKVDFFAGKSPTETQYSDTEKKHKRPLFNVEQWKEHKVNVQKKFKNNEIDILVATKSFGMGIDKENIHYTFHMGIPLSLEAFYQEAGRAGRWDKLKKENYNFRAKCSILHIPHISRYIDLEKLFNINTTVSEMLSIMEGYYEKSSDLRTLLYFIKQNLEDFESTTSEIFNFYTKIFRNKKEPIVSPGNIKILNLKIEEAEKYIYYLTLLGVVEDWTIDYQAGLNKVIYPVLNEELSDEVIISSLEKYIRKYDPEVQPRKDLEKIGKPTFLEKAIYYLLQWTHGNIIYNRLESLKTLIDLCEEFLQNQDSENFKQRIEKYFQFTETTFILQHIAESPMDYKEWFGVFFAESKDPSAKNYIPQNLNSKLLQSSMFFEKNIEKKMEFFQDLKIKMRRFLETYKYSTGLNYLSGLIHLVLDEYETPDGKIRMESGLKGIMKIMPIERAEEILELTYSILDGLEENKKEKFWTTITGFSPTMKESLAERWGVEYILEPEFKLVYKRLQAMNRRIYEQIGKF